MGKRVAGSDAKPSSQLFVKVPLSAAVQRSTAASARTTSSMMMENVDDDDDGSRHVRDAMLRAVSLKNF